MFGSERRRPFLKLWTWLGGLGIACLSAVTASTPLPLTEWQTVEGDIPPRREAGSWVFPCRFPEKVDRQVWDHALDVDLSAADGLEVDFTLVGRTAIRAVTLYVRSGAGWYSVYLPLEHPTGRVYLPFASFTSEGEPAGWGKADLLRISPWRGEGGEGLLKIRGIGPFRARILCVDAAAAEFSSDAEHVYARKLTDWQISQWEQLGFPVARVEDPGVRELTLSRFDLILFPCNPAPGSDTLSALRLYLKKGGRIIAAYSGSEALAELAGFRMGRHLSAQRQRQWEQMEFVDTDVFPGLRIQQRYTDNLIPVSPATADARVLAWWVDVAGRRQREPALLLSATTAWFTAVLTPEDDLHKRRLLAGLADVLAPELEVSVTAIQRRLEAGKPGEEDPLRTGVKAALASADFPAAWNLLAAAEREWQLESARAQPAPDLQFRGIWDHRGSGWFSGDWPRTFAWLNELGFTDVFVYVPRGARTRLPARSATADSLPRAHAWHICWYLPELSPVGLRGYARADRLQLTESGETRPWLCPANPENRESEIRQILQLAEQDGWSGLHFDYLRWPDGPPCVCAHCRQAFQAALGRKPDWPRASREGTDHAAFLKWRAELLTGFVAEVSAAVRAKNPGLRLSAAVWPDYPATVARLGQDWPRWLAPRSLDFVAPMSYTADPERFQSWTRAQVQAAGSGNVWAGIGYTASESRLNPRQVMQQIQTAAAENAAGFALFELSPPFEVELAPVIKALYGGRDPL